MTEGTSQGLFIVVAIVIFGIFVSLSYTLFGKTLQPQIVSLFEQGTEQAQKSLVKDQLAFSSNKEINNKNDIYKHEDEFMQYDDLSPAFNKYGEGNYRIELEIKTNKNGIVQIYTQNGDSTQYHIGHSYVESTTEYTKHSFDIKASKSKKIDTYSMLAFYGTYGTRVFATVKNVKLYKVVDTTEGVK